MTYAPAKQLMHKPVEDDTTAPTRKRKQGKCDESPERTNKRARTPAATNTSKALNELLRKDVCEALCRAGIEDFDTFKEMADWDEDLAQDAFKNDVKLNIIQAGACRQLLRSK